MFQRRFVPILLLLIGVLIIGWQIAEHKRFKDVRKEQLIHRAQDITHTLAIVIRSQRFFGGVIFQPRLETALIDLVQSTGLTSIALFNAQGEVVCAAGEELKRDLSEFAQYGEKWEDNSVTIVNLVDLGIDPRRPEEQEPRTLIISEEERGILRKMRPRPPHRRDRERGSPDSRAETNRNNNETVRSATEEARNDGKTRAQKMRERFGRPPGMDEGEYNTIIQKIGLHGFIIRMSTAHYRFANLYDLWLRASISGFAVIALLGFWFAWRNVIKSSDLQVRLVRANEMNTHLRQMNLAAAGLAHETKNPLNLVRGLAQVMAKNDHTSQEVQQQSIKITEEVDRVTAQLNEFINFSKPCDPNPVPIKLLAVIEDVKKAMEADLEDSRIQLNTVLPDIMIEADERLLRQILFNLLMNSVQAVGEGGTIDLRFLSKHTHRAAMVIEDSGPGVPPEQRDKMFQPYYTTRQEGTGLGLAIVKQIVSAHGWDIEYDATYQAGARFIINNIKVL